MNPLTWNPFAALGLPEWPDLDDETVQAAWQQIAAETHPDRPDGGDLARYTQANAAYSQLSCPWGRTEAYADLVEAAQCEGRWDVYPDPCPPGWGLHTSPPPPNPAHTGLGPIPLSEVLRLLREIPARLRHGHPVRLAIRSAVTAAACLAVLAFLPRGAYPHFWVADLTLVFLVFARQDLAPPTRPVRRLPPPGKDVKDMAASGGASGSRMGSGPHETAGP
jgi:hypothetical protein